MPFTLLQLLSLPLAVLAQQSPRLFIDSGPNQQWAAAVVSQDACATTLDLVCTAGTTRLPAGYGGTITCDPSGFESGFALASATYSGSSIYEVSQSYKILRGGGLKIQATESCSLYGTTSAICSLTVSASTRGIETLIPTVTTYGSVEASQKFFQVPITEGSLITANATCATPAPFTTPTPEPTSGGSEVVGGGAGESQAVASANGRGKLEVQKVVVVPGAAALLAAAGLL